MFIFRENDDFEESPDDNLSSMMPVPLLFFVQVSSHLHLGKNFIIRFHVLLIL
jgi:hypothetical protein